MDFVHCNACQDVPSKESRLFYFTNCMHIYCKKCVEKYHVPNTNSMMCLHCKKQCSIVEIGPNMPPKVKRLFTPFEIVLKEHDATLQRVLAFQEDQLDSLMGFAKKEKMMLLNAFKTNHEAKATIATITNEKSELEGSVAYHKERLTDFERRIKDLRETINEGRTDPGLTMLMNGGGHDFFNVTSQSDPCTYGGGGMDQSMQSVMNSSMDSSFNLFTNGGLFSGHAASTYSSPSTPNCSQLSNLSDLTTPKMLGLTKKGGGHVSASSGGMRSDNPYLAMWNRTSVERQKKASGGRRVNKGGVRSAESNESPMRSTEGKKWQ